MDHSITSHGGICTVTGKGSLTFEDYSSVVALLDNLCTASDGTIIFDLQHVTSIDSAGIGLLLLMSDRLKGAGKSLSLSRPNTNAMQVLEVAKISELIEIKH